MKKQHKMLLFIIAAEFIVIRILQACHVRVQSPVGSAIGVFVFLLPIQRLFFLLSKEDTYSQKKKAVFKVAFWFINFCYLSGVIGVLAEWLGIL